MSAITKKFFRDPNWSRTYLNIIIPFNAILCIELKLQSLLNLCKIATAFLVKLNSKVTDNPQGVLIKFVNL